MTKVTYIAGSKTLTLHQRREIRRRRKAGDSIAHLASIFNVSQGTICAVAQADALGRFAIKRSAKPIGQQGTGPRTPREYPIVVPTGPRARPVDLVHQVREAALNALLDQVEHLNSPDLVYVLHTIGVVK